MVSSRNSGAAPPPSPRDDLDCDPVIDRKFSRLVTLVMPGQRVDTRVRKSVLAVTNFPVHIDDTKPPINYESHHALPQVISLWQAGASAGVTLKEELQRSAGRFEPKPLTEVVNYLNRRARSINYKTHS